MIRFITLSLLLPFSLAIFCNHPSDCNDGDSSTVDFCTPHGRCINFINTAGHQEQSAVVRVNRTHVIFEANKVSLTVAQKRQVTSLAISTLKDVNPHRFQHLNFLNIDPVLELESLDTFLLSNNGALQTNLQFHEAMTGIYQKMNDLHSVYTRPQPLGDFGAILGFVMAQFHESDDLDKKGNPRRKYLLQRTSAGIIFQDGKFVPGVEMLKYDGVNIDEAVLKIGKLSMAANFAAKQIWGQRLLVSRNFFFEPLPENDSATIQFRTLDGEIRTITLPWIYLFFRPDTPDSSPEPVPESTPEIDMNLKSWETLDIRERQLNEKESESRARQAQSFDLLYKDPVEQKGWLPTSTRLSENATEIMVMPDFTRLFNAEIISTSKGAIGRLHLTSFASPLTEALMEELRRVISQFPSTGLIIDIRDNGGGNPDIGKFIIDLVSNKNTIQFMNPTNHRTTNLINKLHSIASQDSDNGAFLGRKQLFSPFAASMATARKLGETFTGPGPPVTRKFVGAQRFAQIYSGPIVTVMNALSYSASDIFAAVAVDSRASKLVGVSDTTGAGGANVFSSSLIVGGFPELFTPLPDGIVLTTAFLRYYRTGTKAGAVVEGFGVRADIRYYRTRKDLFEGDCDLSDFLAGFLSSQRS